MDTKILEDLGLTSSETKVYLTLLEVGTSSAGIIIDKSKLQNSVVHRAIKSLTEKGLISYILKGKHKVYSATEPEYFLKFIDEKKKDFEKILPELKEKELKKNEETHTSMYKGKKGINEVYSRLISQEGEFLTFGGSKKTTDFMGLTWWRNMYIRRIANKINQRHIASDEVLSYIKPFLKMKRTKMKFLSKEVFSQYQETAIVGEYVAITIFADEGYSILIKNREVAEGYKKNFELMWKLAKEKNI